MDNEPESKRLKQEATSYTSQGYTPQGCPDSSLLAWGVHLLAERERNAHGR
jgi:hypothetical protein